MVKRGERRRGKEKKKLYIVLGLNPDSLLPPPTTNFSRRKRNIYFLGVKTRERRRRERERKKGDSSISVKYTPIFVAHFYQDGTDAFIMQGRCMQTHPAKWRGP